MKKLFVLISIFLFVFTLFLIENPVEAAKKSAKKKGGLSQEQVKEINETIDRLTQKVYAKSLFSPEDNSLLIEIKIKLDDGLLVSQDPSYSNLYFKAANLYKAREFKSEAIDCYRVILENFSSTPFAPKAQEQLKAMGVSVEIPDINKGDSQSNDSFGL